MRRTRWLTLSWLLFFYLEGIRVLFSHLFGVLYDALFAGPFRMSALYIIIAAFLAFLLPAYLTRMAKHRFTLFVIGSLLLLFHLALHNENPVWRLYAGLGTVFFGSWLFATLYARQKNAFFTPFVTALVIDQFARLAGHSQDIAIAPSWLIADIVISSLLIIGFWWTEVRSARGENVHNGISWQCGISLGAFLFLELNLLNYPNAVARWTGTAYSWQAVLLLSATLLPLLPAVNVWTIRTILAQRGRRFAFSLLLIASLVIGYTYTGWLAGLLLALAQFSVLIIWRYIVSCDKPTRPRNKLATGLLLFLLLDFANAFAFTYPYTLAIFRNSGLLIYFTAAVLFILPIMGNRHYKLVSNRPTLQWVEGGLVALLLLSAAWMARPPRVASPAQDGPLKLATYNIHYGYSSDWHAALPAIADDIAASGADVVTLQEVDTGRLTSYMVDDALWLANRLGMYAVYLPTVEKLTGIAILSRYPVENAKTVLLPSDLEQTGIIQIVFRWRGSSVHGYGLWLGLTAPERAQQIKRALSFIGTGSGPAFLGGDFNSTPTSPTYRAVAAAGFRDPFHVLKLGDPPTDPAIHPRERIDFIWLRDLSPVAAEVSPRLGSDHRSVSVRCQLPAK